MGTDTASEALVLLDDPSQSHHPSLQTMDMKALLA